MLDKYFGSVCELDIIFNFEKAYFILDELILGGEMQVKNMEYRFTCSCSLLMHLLMAPGNFKEGCPLAN